MRRASFCAFGVLLLTLICPAAAHASAISFPVLTDPGTVTQTGTFVHDNDLAVFGFILTGDATFYASTDDGPGGLDPLLTLLRLDAGGQATWVTDNDDSPLGGADSLFLDPITLEPGILLNAGAYQLVLSQTFNYFDPLSGGFSFDDDPLYTCEFSADPAGCAAAGGFQPLGTSTGTAFSVTYGTTPPGDKDVPEPSTLLLLGTGLTTMVGAVRRRTY